MSLSGSQTDDFVALGGAPDVSRADEGPEDFPEPVELSPLMDEALDGLRSRVVFFPVLTGAALFCTLGVVNAARFAVRDSLVLSQVLAWSLAVAVTWSLLTVSGVAAGLWFPRGGARRVDAVAFLRGSFVCAIIAFLGVLAGTPIVPLGLRLIYRWCYAPAAAAQQGLGPVAALRESWRMTRKARSFTPWFQALVGGFFLGIAPAILGGLLNGPALERALVELDLLDANVLRLLLRPPVYLMFGAALAMPALMLGRFQVDMLVRRRAPDLFARLARRFPEDAR